MSKYNVGRWDSHTDEPAAQDMANDATAHFSRTDPGQSLPSECRHDFFAVGRCHLGRFKCHWCGLVLIAAES